MWLRWAGRVMLDRRGRWSWWSLDQAQNINEDSVLSFVVSVRACGHTLAALLSSNDLILISSSFISKSSSYLLNNIVS